MIDLGRVAGYTNTNGLFLVLTYALHLLCFRVVLVLFTLTTRQPVLVSLVDLSD